MTSFRLTVDLVDILDAAEAGRTVTLHPMSTRLTRRVTAPRINAPTEHELLTDVGGNVGWDVVHSDDYAPPLKYQIQVAGTPAHEFFMPARDTTLWSILADEYVPPAPIPATQDGWLVRNPGEARPASGITGVGYYELGSGVLDIWNGAEWDTISGGDAGGTVDQAARDAAATNASNITELETSTANNRTGLATLEGRYDALEPDPSTIDANERYLAAVRRGGAVVTYWDLSRQVPIAGRVGSVLTKTGVNDTDFEFRVPVAGDIADDSITPGKLLADEAAQQAAFRARIAAASQADLTTVTDNLQQAQRDVGTARTEAGNAAAAAAAARSLTRRLRPISTWLRQGAAAQNVHLHWRPSADVTRGAAIAVTIGGTANNITAAEALSAADDDGAVLTVPVTAANAGSIDRASNTVAGYVEAQITFDSVVYTCWLEAADAPRAPRVLQAAVDVSGGGSNLGAASITLPANYATYHDLNIALFESQDNALADHDIRTSILAAQRGQVEITVAGNPGVAAAASVTWNPQSRVVTALTQRNAPVRIVYAELHD